MDVASVLTLALLGLYLGVRPWSVLAAILLVTARDGLKKESAYVAGWVTALVLVAGATVLLYPDIPKGATSSRTEAAVELAIGVVLGGWLLVHWRGARGGDGTSAQPRWMGRVDGISPLPAFGLGAFLPSYVVIVAAVTEMISTGLTRGALALAALGWVLLASTGVASPLLVLLVRRQDAPGTYQRWRSWLVAHNRAVLYATGGLVSLALAGKGALGLVG